MNKDYTKFGQVTIIYDNGLIDYMWRNYFGKEPTFTDKTNIIVLFNENNQMYELNKLPIERYMINEEYSKKKIPNYIKINKLGIYKMKSKNEKPKSNTIFSQIFKSKYNKVECMDSVYNCIFYLYDRQYVYNERIVFSLFKSKQSSDSCQFIFSYDESKFTEIQVYNIIRMILTSL
jgi:hypothetical protein